MNKPNTVVVDLDGTLANIDHRAHLVKKDAPEWDKFYSSCDKDTPNSWCVELMRAMQTAGFTVIILSARRDTTLSKTKAWLRYHAIPHSQLILLRKGNESTPDTVLKKAWLDSYGKENVLFVVDDRQKVVDAWRSNGVTCLQCYAWKEYDGK